MFALKSSLVLLALLSSQARASIGPVSTLNIANANISPDGYSRSAVLAGGSFPGPVITGKKGDNFRLNVVNALTDTSMDTATSIHWHGIFQKGTAWADGTAFVTQCPIPSGSSFLYNFNVPDQAGTFWYHSHLSDQYCDGLRGVFVVYDPNDPQMGLYDVDDETTIITLADWYHRVSPQQAQLPVPLSDSILINGLGRYPGGPASPLAVINVVAGKRYRFRLVSISCDPNFKFSIDGHMMTIIEVDGENVTPLVVDSIQIFAGQRYSFVLNANQRVDNYWIHSEPSTQVPVIGSTGGLNSAILRYKGAIIHDPTTTASQATLPLAETNLHPLTNPAAPGAPGIGNADVNIELRMEFNPLTFQYTINKATFVSPGEPVLVQILNSTVSDAASLQPLSSIYSLPRDKVIEVTIVTDILSNVAGAPHPFHLHGHTFNVVRSAGNSTYNYDNPVRRDVVNTGVLGDSVTMRFTTDNPGPWIMHCHIDWHLTRGLAIVFVEDLAGIKANPVPAQWQNLCPTYEKSLPAKASGSGGILGSILGAFS